MTIADRIKDKRIDLDMSQTELALKAGYSNKAAISKLEHAGDDISMKQVKRVAKALGVSPAFLMGWEDELSNIRLETLAKILPNTTYIDKDGYEIEQRDLSNAIRLYEAYLNAIPQVQEAVERLLKSDLSDS